MTCMEANHFRKASVSPWKLASSTTEDHSRLLTVPNLSMSQAVDYYACYLVHEGCDHRSKEGCRVSLRTGATNLIIDSVVS